MATSLFDPDQKFNELQSKSKNELIRLNNKCVQENIFDPLVYKQRYLIEQLNFILDDLPKAWLEAKHGEESNKKDLLKAMQLVHQLSLSLDDLNIQNEKRFIEKLDEFNGVTKNYNDNIKKLRSTIASMKKQKTLIERLFYGRTLSFSASYLGTVSSVFAIIGFACQVTLKEAIRQTGVIFNPIVSVFTSIEKLIDVVSSIGQVKTARAITLDTLFHQEQLKAAEKLLQVSNALKVASFIANTLTIFVFAGLLLTNPIGWGIVALACIIDWIETGLVGVKKAKLEYEIAKKKALVKDSEGKVSDQAALDNFNNKAMALEKAKSVERWGRMTVLAMILFACAPIPIVGQALMVAGLVTFAVVVARNVYVAVKPRYAAYKKAKEEKAKGEVEMVEFSQNTKEKDLSKEHRNVLEPKPAPVAEVSETKQHDTSPATPSWLFKSSTSLPSARDPQNDNTQGPKRKI